MSAPKLLNNRDKRVLLYVTEDLYNNIEKVAKKRNISKNELCNLAISQYVKRWLKDE